AGMDDYLPKPVTRSELERCLHRWWTPEQAAATRHEPYAQQADGSYGEAPGPEPVPGEAGDADAAAAGAGAGAGVSAAAHAGGGASAAAAATPRAEAVAEPMQQPRQPLSYRPAASAVQTAPAPPASVAQPLPPAGGASVSLTDPAMRTAQPLVIDPDILDELRAMLGNEVERLVDVFLEDTPRLIGALENAAVGPDFDALRDAAHSLKSSSANLGAMSLSAAAKRVELGARERSLDRPAVAVAVIANEFARVAQALRPAGATRA
ncbi:MAG TPA: response regulator, partial [Luteimonas sp.]|nr:response regulator [Luteimonas sp.]